MSDIDPCSRTVQWGEQTYRLNLNHPWVQRVLSWRGINGKPPAAVLIGFESGNYTADDCERVLELGLIGAGMGEREAEKLIADNVSGKPVAANARVAASVLVGLFMGVKQ